MYANTHEAIAQCQQEGGDVLIVERNFLMRMFSQKMGGGKLRLVGCANAASMLCLQKRMRRENEYRFISEDALSCGEG